MNFFCFSAWSKHVCYVMKVEFNCNFISTKIVLIVSINIKELTRKTLCFETVDDECHSCLVLKILNDILCKEHCANISVT